MENRKSDGALKRQRIRKGKLYKPTRLDVINNFLLTPAV